MNEPHPGQIARAGGFTLVEVTIALVLCLIVAVGTGLAVQGGLRVTREIGEDQQIIARAQLYMDQIWTLPFGSPQDPSPGEEELSELFDADDDVPALTLTQLAAFPPRAGGWVFVLARFPVLGRWRITVDRDLDGDGLVSGPLEQGDDVYRIAIYFEDRLYLESARATVLGG